jgi:precorrin-6x reductase
VQTAAGLLISACIKVAVASAEHVAIVIDVDQPYAYAMNASLRQACYTTQLGILVSMLFNII